MAPQRLRRDRDDDASASHLLIERLCALAGVSRATYYRHWREAAPRTEETSLRDVVQRLAIGHRHDGYRRLTALVRREGWAVNHKRVLV